MHGCNAKPSSLLVTRDSRKGQTGVCNQRLPPDFIPKPTILQLPRRRRCILSILLVLSGFYFVTLFRNLLPSKMSKLTLNSTVQVISNYQSVGLIPQLNSGYSIPVIALGVYQAKSEECYNAVLAALEAGYRHIDSAAWYGNEADVGRAVSKWLKDSGNKREDVRFPIYNGLID